MDIVHIISNGDQDVYMFNINLISSTLKYMLTPLTSFIWLLYVDYKIHENKTRIKRKFTFFIIPIMISSFLIIANLISGEFYQTIFSIDSSNTYSRGPYFYIVMMVSYWYLLWSFYEIIKNRGKIEIRDFFYLSSFIMLPIFSGIIQMRFYGIKLTWPSLTLSIFMIYINIQNKQIYLDALTGLYNRRKINLYLDDIIDISKNNLIGGIMIDLDDFKTINDTFGHSEGDKALIYVSNILKYNFRREDFIARYAGDEFLIIMKLNSKDEIKSIVNRLEDNIAEFNKKNITPYKLSLSIGYDIFHPDSYIDIEEFVNRIDNLMYRQKESKKLQYIL